MKKTASSFKRSCAVAVADLRRAIFLDRDGVLNADAGYTHRATDLRVLAGVPQALKDLKNRGFVLVVVTNQSGVARGLYGLDDVARFHAALDAALIKQGGVAPDAYYICPHLVDGAVAAFRKDCDCRKPKPGMVLDAATALGLDLAKSFLVGDRVSDIACAAAAGVRAVQVMTTDDTADSRAIASVASLRDALPYLV